MAITAHLDLLFKPEAVEQARELFHGVLADTRAFDGCLGVEVLVDSDNEAHWLVSEQWASAEADAAYREFRAGPGAITELGPLLAGAPSLTKFTVDDRI